MSDPTGLTKDGALEPVIKLLAGLIVFCLLLMVIVSKWSPNDGQTFQVIGNLLSGFAGALMMRIKPDGGKDNKGDKQQ